MRIVVPAILCAVRDVAPYVAALLAQINDSRTALAKEEKVHNCRHRHTAPRQELLVWGVGAVRVVDVLNHEDAVSPKHGIRVLSPRPRPAPAGAR